MSLIRYILVVSLLSSSILALLSFVPFWRLPIGWTLIGGCVAGACFWLLVVLPE